MRKIKEKKVSDAHVARKCNGVAFKKVQTEQVTFNNLLLHLLTQALECALSANDHTDKLLALQSCPKTPYYYLE